MNRSPAADRSTRGTQILWCVLVLWVSGLTAQAVREVGALPDVEGVVRVWTAPRAHPWGELIDPRPLDLPTELFARYGLRVAAPEDGTLDAWRRRLDAAGVTRADDAPASTPRLVFPAGRGPVLVVSPFGQQWVVAVPGEGVVVTAPGAFAADSPGLALPGLTEAPL